MKKTTSPVFKSHLSKLSLFIFILLSGLINDPVTAQSQKSVSFVQSSESADIQQGSTQSLTEYISTSDNVPVSATLTAKDGGSNVPSWLSVNGNVLDGLNYTTGSEISFSFDATNLSVGKYYAVVRASASGYVTAVLQIYLTVTSANTGTLANIKVNFQDSLTIPPAGWVRDYGQPFSLRTSAYQDSGNAYGWIKRLDNTLLDLSKNARRRKLQSDKLKATLIFMQGGDVSSKTLTKTEGIWQCQVANGNYKVTVCAGEDSLFNSKHSINIEQVSAISKFVPTKSNKYKVATITVCVSDGYLSVDAKGGTNTKINYIIIEPDSSKRPSIVSVNPQNSSINVNENSSISSSILRLPNSGVNNATITSANVYLAEEGTGILVPSTVNGTGGGDALTLVPDVPLKLNTVYRFIVTSGVKDLSDSSFIPYSCTFTTGSRSTGDIINAQFDKVALPNTVGQHSSLTIGPDGKLYALTIDGIIQRYVINPDGTLQDPQLIYTLQDEYGARQQRLAIGLAFDPSSTADNLVLWVTHSTFVFLNGPDWDGKLSKLSGPGLEDIQDMVVNLTRSKKDHLTNGIAFGPDGALYLSQASNSAMGRADNTWGYRMEHLLSASCLRLDVSKITTFPLDAKTPDGGGTYNPYAPDAPLTLYATGIRNAYDLLWHSNGQLYLPANGSAAGGNTPASVAGTIRPDGASYSGPSVPALFNVQQTQNDYLYRVTKGGYYGHPNPLRGEYVLNGGNPTSPIDPAQVTEYPLGTTTDENFRGYSFNFQTNKSPNGVIEYKSNAFNGALKGQIMVVRYSQNNDIITLTPGGINNDIVNSTEGPAIAGFSGFNDPLDLTEDTTNGNLYVSEYGNNGKITLVKPRNIVFSQKLNVTLSPIADAYVRDGSYSGSNYGRDTSLLVKTASSGYNRRSYLKFALDSAVTGKIGNITSARLRIYGRNTSNFAYINVGVFAVSNDTWTETGIKWNNAPSGSNPSLSVVGIGDLEKYYEFDVTKYVSRQAAGDKKASFLLKDTTNSDRILSLKSREHMYSPQLFIQGDSINPLQQRKSTTVLARSNAAVANVSARGNRTVNSTSQLPIVYRSFPVKRVPSCDEPGDEYSEDTVASPLAAAIATAPVVQKPVPFIKSSGKLTIYPNPLRKEFHIRFPFDYEGRYYLQMIDPVGRIYKLGTTILQRGGADVVFNISKMPLKPGLYFLMIRSDNKLMDVLKLMVQY